MMSQNDMSWTIPACQPTIIDNTKEARDKFGHMWGSGDVVLSREDIDALFDGKVVAVHDGEYVDFIVLESDNASTAST